MRIGDNASQISDEDECQGGGLCPSCRLAVNKDTGRLKWCMGGNDIWRTRIRFMLLIPAVILPIAIIIIAISKSTVIGKLSLRSNTRTNDEVTPSRVDDTTDTAAFLDRSNYMASIKNDIIDQSEVTERIFHPDVETSFIPTESFIATQNLERHKREMSQVDARKERRRSKQREEIVGTERRSRKGAPSKTITRRRINVADSRAPTDYFGNCKQKTQKQSRSKLKRRRRSKELSESVAELRPEEDHSKDDDCEDGPEDNTGDESVEDSRSENEGAEQEEEEEEEKEDSRKTNLENNEALHWLTRSANSPRNLFDIDEGGDDHRVEKDDSLSYSDEASDESLNFRAFWKGDWNEDFIRRTQARMMSNYMDKTVDPCQDFYQYSCGNWEKYNPIPEDKAGFDTFEILRESLDLVLKQLLEEPTGNDLETNEDNAIVKAKNLYRSCMNYEILERRMESPLLELLDDLGGWPILEPRWDPDRFDWLLLVAQLRLYNNDILISEWIGPDIKNSDQYVIQFDQTTLGLPTKDYFLQPSNAIYLMAYKNYLITIATLLGASVRTASIQAEELIQFEIQLANITISPDERRNLSDLYKRMTLNELHLMIPQIDWHRYLSIVLARPVNFSEPIILFATKYLQNLVKLLAQTPPRIVANYLFWRFVRHRVNNLDDRFQEAKQTFYYILFGREKSPSRWKNCVAQVNSNMGMAVGSIFVRKYFDENSKNDTLSMTHEIQRSFRELLNQSTWLDPMTKQVASEKVEAMQLRIGYPDFILHDRELDERYRNVNIHPDRYFENILNILRHLMRMEQNRLGAPVNKTVWNAAPAVVNAYYSRNKNQIMFPAGILQPPFYHKYFPRSLNYGGVGVVIGHEITHGFDDKGRLFDKYGNLHRWWSDETINEFDQRASCLIDQYGKYTVKEIGMRIDGVNTQGENIADNGGVKQAFRAYEKWLSLNKNANENLPGIDATGRQLFFLNFAQVWCGSMRPEAMKNKLKTAVHSPGKYRVIGTLSNSKEFAKVFNCPLGSPMNPEKKCLVW